MKTLEYPLSSKLKNMSESATIRMAQLARDLKSQGKDVISLSLGEPDFDTPIHIKEAAKTALDQAYTKYTPVPGLVEFREAISRKFKRDNQLDYGIHEIMVSNGAKQCIANTCLALLDPGDEVIIFAPYWVSYFEIVKFAGGIPILLCAGIEDDFKVSAAELAKTITSRTKLIIFSSPCNPTGSVFSKDDIADIAQVIRQHENVYVISDEIYEHINFAGDHVSIAAETGMMERTITVNGMSKGFAMTGWRLGYMGAPQWIISACVKVQGQFTSGASSFGQKAAAIALDADLKPTLQMKSAFLKRRDLVISLLKDIPGMHVNHPEGAFYIFPDISSFFGKSNGEIQINNANDFSMLLLEKAHVAVVSGTAFGNSDCFRLSYAASEENLIEAIRRIKHFLSDFR